MTWRGPFSSVSSSCFLHCNALQAGGGLYQNSNLTSSSLSITNCLFTKNCAQYSGEHGGGGFEDFREGGYSSQYSYLFFSENTAPNGNGSNILIYYHKLNMNYIIH